MMLKRFDDWARVKTREGTFGLYLGAITFGSSIVGTGLALLLVWLFQKPTP